PEPAHFVSSIRLPEVINKACNHMSIQRSTTLSLLAVAGLAFLGLLCPKAEAADGQISIPRFSFSPSALSSKQLTLPPPGQCLGVLAQRNTLAFLGPWSVRAALWGNWVTEIMNKTETWLSNRTHMIQFCAIGMLVALVIIWWRKT